jgi:hypothetical protein
LTINYQPSTRQYWLNLVPHRPPYVVLCNFNEFWIYDFNTQLCEPVDRVPVADLPARHAALNFLFPRAFQPLFGRNWVQVTRETAKDVANAFNSLVFRGEDRVRARRFILQCVVAMFAEDIGLLPQDIFTRLLDECRRGASSYDLIGGLFRQMNDPNPARAGRYAGVGSFNGGLFATVDPIELAPPELGPSSPPPTKTTGTTSSPSSSAPSSKAASARNNATPWVPTSTTTGLRREPLLQTGRAPVPV